MNAQLQQQHFVHSPLNFVRFLFGSFLEMKLIKSSLLGNVPVFCYPPTYKAFMGIFSSSLRYFAIWLLQCNLLTRGGWESTLGMRLPYTFYFQIYPEIVFECLSPGKNNSKCENNAVRTLELQDVSASLHLIHPHSSPNASSSQFFNMRLHP